MGIQVDRYLAGHGVRHDLVVAAPATEVLSIGRRLPHDVEVVALALPVVDGLVHARLEVGVLVAASPQPVDGRGARGGVRLSRDDRSAILAGKQRVEETVAIGWARCNLESQFSEGNGDVDVVRLLRVLVKFVVLFEEAVDQTTEEPTVGARTIGQCALVALVSR